MMTSSKPVFLALLALFIALPLPSHAQDPSSSASSWPEWVTNDYDCGALRCVALRQSYPLRCYIHVPLTNLID